MNREILLEAKNISKEFRLPDGHSHVVVLDDINMKVSQGEVVALLGRSGSGKSTLLKILAGLIPPTSGQVINKGKPLIGTNPDVAMVFQSFALLPWLTVLENVELGLKARYMNPKETHERALKAIDIVGLDGYESAYPKELSDGMKQRVGFARAFVLSPSVLFMDEPFSSLDVLTAENLRGEIVDLWDARSFPAKSIFMVTHNIDEAILLADRVLILKANPGHIQGEMTIDIPRPRTRDDERFKWIVNHIYTVLTNPEMAVENIPTAPVGESRIPPLPTAEVGKISGLLELLIEDGGKDDILEVASRLHLEVDDLLPILDAAALLGFAKVEAGDVIVTDTGRNFAGADITSSKDIFRKQVLSNAPLVEMIYRTLQHRERKIVRAAYFLELLEDQYAEDTAEKQFEVAVNWGRFAELYEYDANEGRLRIGG